MPISQRGIGRDHNPGAMTTFLAGAGIQAAKRLGPPTSLATRLSSRS
ncbi:MAG: DUF1501 domain-containing protein [Acidobacteria bacterium]|nr:DUF1501 domain-containing protein [Acidobacteriota bacterium]